MGTGAIGDSKKTVGGEIRAKQDLVAQKWRESPFGDSALAESAFGDLTMAESLSGDSALVESVRGDSALAKPVNGSLSFSMFSDVFLPFFLHTLRSFGDFWATSSFCSLLASFIRILACASNT